MAAAVARECRITRAAVGLFDASTLGKIEIGGPDAAAFVARIYANHWPRLAPGQCRYGLMLKDDGTIFDDGIVAMLAPDRFHVTTTTSGAARVLHHMEDYRQTEWPELRVWLTSVTEQWAVISVQGPQARETLRPLVEGIDISSSGDAAHDRSRRTDLRGAGAAVPGQLYRRTGLRGQRARGRGVQPFGRRSRLKSRPTPAPGTAPRRCTSCAPRKAIFSSGKRPMALSRRTTRDWARCLAQAKPDFVGKRGALRR